MKKNLANVSTSVACLFLIVMVIFHGSGYSFVVELFNESNAKSFLKDIFPTLFIHPSIHLAGIAGLGILSFFMGDGARLLRIALAALVLVDAILGFVVGGLIPGIALSLVVVGFLVGALRSGDKVKVGQ